MRLRTCCLFLLAGTAIVCCIFRPVGVSAAQESALTIYDQNFAVVRQILTLDLKAGVTPVEFTDITAKLEPESVVLRDPLGKRALQILEQNYQPDPISQEALLLKYEGQTIDFIVQSGDHTERIKGKIIRAGRAATGNYGPYGYAQTQQPAEPIIEAEGQLRFSLPGIPLFPGLGPDATMKPTLNWKIQSSAPGPLNAELSYLTGGMTWHADYNAVAPPSGNTLELVGWVTMQNESGRTFENARIKLMAGDVSKVAPQAMPMARLSSGPVDGAFAMAPPVTEKAFDEYHLYTLERPATLRDHETKQVEFLRAANVPSVTEYIYDGVKLNVQPGISPEYLRQNREAGADSQTKVWAMQKIVNSKANGLGMPLPKGRWRFYRRDSDGRLEFTGENNIDHTPSDDTLRIYTGNAFDLSGERQRTNYHIDMAKMMIDESFEIHVRNHKNSAAAVTVIEHLFRAANWAIAANSAKYNKASSNQIEFPIMVPPGGEQVISYSVHYTW
jgi:hypothetical protein